MRRLIQWAMAAALVCGAGMFTACINNDNPAPQEGTVTRSI